MTEGFDHTRLPLFKDTKDMAENPRKAGRKKPEQLQLIHLQAGLDAEAVAVFFRVGTCLMMRMLAAHADPTVKALIKSFEHTMMAGFASLSQAVKEVIRDLMRETVRVTSQATPLATSHVSDEAVPTPVSRGQPQRGGLESWGPMISVRVRTDIDVAAGGKHDRDALVMETIQQFRAVMRKGITKRDTIIDPIRARILQPDVRRSCMTLHLRSQWHSEVTRRSNRVDRKLRPNQMLEIILRWRLNQIHEGHEQPSGA
jgi:hypothetical protein